MISNLGSADPFSAEDKQTHTDSSFDFRRGPILFDAEDGSYAASYHQPPPVLPPKPEAWRTNTLNSKHENIDWSLPDSNNEVPPESGNSTPKSGSNPIISARSLSPEFQPPSELHQVPISTPTSSTASWEQDQGSDLDLVSPPESLANGWEQDSSFSFPISSSNSQPNDSIDGRPDTEDLVLLSPSANSGRSDFGNANNPFDEAWVVDEEEEEEDRRARAQFSYSETQHGSRPQSQFQSQATIRQIRDDHSVSGESWADMAEADTNMAAVNTQGLRDSWKESRSSFL